MKRNTRFTLMTLVFVLAIMLLMSGSAGAAPNLIGGGAPTVVNYQGQVTVDGIAYTGTGYFKFAVVDQAGTTTYWSNDSTSSGGSAPTAAITLTVTNGLFNVLLGNTTLTNMTTLPASAFEGPERYLRVWFSSDGNNFTLLTPDRRIAAVPYALQAEEAKSAADADTLDSLHASAFYAQSGNTFGTVGTLGTNDAYALELEVNNSRVLRLEPNATSPNLIGGYSGNWLTSGVYGAVIAGGGYSGEANRVTDPYGAVGGGYGNQAGLDDGTPDFYHSSATVTGGEDNTASGHFATVVGGWQNTASGEGATVAGGYKNVASGSWTMVAGGESNVAQGYDSFAAGRQAKAYSDGCFVWGDSYWADITCNTTDAWVARASGGVTFYTNRALSTGVQVAAGGGSWASVSDRNLKANFQPVDGRAVLELVANLPISTWNYTSQAPAIRHIGPMAQDFATAFKVGEDDTHITTIDADGVALASIQGLYQENQTLKAQINALEARLAALEGRVNSGSTSGFGGWGTVGLALLGLVAGAIIVRERRV
jgi:hypothetical protein